MLTAVQERAVLLDELRISVSTVRDHVQHVLTQLGAHSELEALAVASRLDLLRTDRGRS